MRQVLYRILLVEDEIVTREGIRDSVDWTSAGFRWCGDAPDGEIALGMIEAEQPEILITDIKMPFMDGLELSRIVRQRLPQTRIVILKYRCLGRHRPRQETGEFLGSTEPHSLFSRTPTTSHC